MAGRSIENPFLKKSVNMNNLIKNPGDMRQTTNQAPNLLPEFDNQNIDIDNYNPNRNDSFSHNNLNYPAYDQNLAQQEQYELRSQQQKLDELE